MVSALIVAAGKGERLPGDLAKQYLPLAGRPVLCRTLDVFAACGFIDDIFLIIPENDFDYCRKAILPLMTMARPINLVAGGERRQDSVFGGLRAVGGGRDRTVVVHDGVRPFVTPEMIRSCIDGIGDGDGCIAAVPVSDTLKTVDLSARITATVDRAGVWMAQTPQAFRYEALFQAHQQAAERQWQATDDAALLERLGKTVHVCPGSVRNIKLTTPDDLLLAAAIAVLMDKNI